MGEGTYMTKKRKMPTMADLLGFNPHEQKREECVITWKCLALEVGVSADTIQRWFTIRQIQLPRWGPFDNSPVYLPRVKMAVLKTLYFG
jgi:hypothetical protein